MFKVKTLNHISPSCMEIMTPDRYEISDTMADPDAIFVRATDMHNYEFNPALRCIARAGIGVNSIPLKRCSEAGIMASRDLMGGMRWVYNYNNPDVPVEVAMEKIKKQFAGPEYYRKSIGVIGTGNVGCLVANIALDMGMTVYGYDPYLSVNAAWRVSRHVIRVDDLDTLLRNCDYITLHTPLTDETRCMINAARIAKMKDGVRIINYARGEVVDEDAIIDALHSGKVERFVTDFPTARLIQEPKAILTPHLGGTTVEAEANCARMAAEEMDDYLRTGNIKNSVNMPDLHMDRTGPTRICIIHRNLPGMLTTLLPIFAKDQINIENMTNKSRGEYAYSVFDLNADVEESVVSELKAIEGVLRVRVLH